MPKSVVDQLRDALRLLKAADQQAAKHWEETTSTAAENVMTCTGGAIKEIEQCLEFYAADLDKQILFG